MDDRQSLIDEENAERAEKGAPLVPGGSGEAKSSHGGAVVAAALAGAMAVLLAVAVVLAASDLLDAGPTPTWVGSGTGTVGGANTPEGRYETTSVPQSDEEATGRYYAFWKYDDVETWGYVFDLYADGTGEFHLFLAEDGRPLTREDVDAEDFTEPLVWRQDGASVTLDNPTGEDTLPDAPNAYVLGDGAGGRVLSPVDPDGYQYPGEVLYEDFDEALANMSE